MGSWVTRNLLYPSTPYFNCILSHALKNVCITVVGLNTYVIKLITCLFRKLLLN